MIVEDYNIDDDDNYADDMMERLVCSVYIHRVTVPFHGWLTMALPIHMDDEEVDDD